MSDSQSQPDTLEAPLILVIGLAGAIFLMDLIVATSALVYNWAEAKRQANVVNQPVVEAVSHLQDQREKLVGYRLLDGEGRRVQIPIERAMQLYVDRQAGVGRPDDAVEPIRTKEQAR